MNGRIGAPALSAGRPRWLPLGVLLGLVALSFATRAAMAWQWPMPFCWLRKYAGIPCPACGSTRSLAAWAQFDVAGALAYNPLFFLGTVAVMLWAAVWAADKTLSRSWLPGIESFVQRRPVWKILAALAVLNWLYLCLALPG